MTLKGACGCKLHYDGDGGGGPMTNFTFKNIPEAEAKMESWIAWVVFTVYNRVNDVFVFKSILLKEAFVCV